MAVRLINDNGANGSCWRVIGTETSNSIGWKKLEASESEAFVLRNSARLANKLVTRV